MTKYVNEIVKIVIFIKKTEIVVFKIDAFLFNKLVYVSTGISVKLDSISSGALSGALVPLK